MKKLLLILLCLPFIGFGQKKNSIMGSTEGTHFFDGISILHQLGVFDKFASKRPRSLFMSSYDFNTDSIELALECFSNEIRLNPNQVDSYFYRGKYYLLATSQPWDLKKNRFMHR